MSATQTEPNADAIEPPSLTSGVEAISRGGACAGTVSSDRSAVAASTIAIASTPSAASAGASSCRRAIRQGRARRSPCRAQLELELVHEVLPHRLLPIRSRARRQPAADALAHRRLRDVLALGDLP
jgi:hypothetical protein